MARSSLHASAATALVSWLAAIALGACSAVGPGAAGEAASPAPRGALEQEAREIQPLLLEQDRLERMPGQLQIVLASDAIFESKGATLQRGASDRLHKLGAVLQRYPAASITVIGHTDGRGRTSTNAELSRRRATVVATALGEGGADAARVTARGDGESRPVAPGDTIEGRARNRRIEIVVIPVGAASAETSAGAAPSTGAGTVKASSGSRSR